MESSSSDGEYHQWMLTIFLDSTLQIISSDIVIAILAIFILIIISALISGSEVAYFSLNVKEINNLRQQTSKSSEVILRLLLKPRYLLATILITNNLVNVAIVVLSYYIFSPWIAIHPILGLLVNVLGVTLFIVFFGEVLPKIYATKYNLSVAKTLSYPILILRRLFYPFSHVLVSSTRLIERRFESKSSNVSLEELEQAIDLTQDERSTKQDVNILKGIVKFGNITVKQIMTARVDVTSIDETMNYKDLVDFVRKSGYSRVPVFKENLDNIIGVLYVKDLLGYLDEGNEFKWQNLVRQPFFIPETKKIDDLLKEIQENRVHLAVVVDEYGGTSGIITLEDIIEEVIGEIKDEYDQNETEYQKIDKYNYIFEGKTLINDVCKVLGLRDDVFDESRGDADSLAGLILELQGMMPAKNEEVIFQNFKFKVISLGKNRIKKVKISLLDNEESE